MDSSTSDFPITTDLDLTDSYNFNSNRISPVAIFLILILIIMLIGFFINNLTVNNFEPNLENNNTTTNELVEVKSEKKLIHPTDIKQALNITNQELNNSINKLTDLVNKTKSENQNYTDEIKILEKHIQDLKSEIIILQSKLLDKEINKSEGHNKNINITTEPNPNLSYTYNNFQDDVVIYDPIANYDRLKLTDPLVDPRGRSSADQIPTPQVAAQLNFPTQGVIDRYHRVGLLIAINGDSDNSHKNKKRFNPAENNIDYSNDINNTKYNKYNGIDIVSSSSSLNNLSSSPLSVYSSSTPSITSLSPKTEKTKKNRRKKHKNKKEHFELEGFSVEDNYETFENNSNYDNEDYFTNLENTIYEGFGNMDSNKNINSVNVGYDDNNILELIGKKITDNWYKYFTSISVGNKVIKINVHNRNRRELYSGDVVFIPELGKSYRVQIDKMDMIEYNPYFF